MYLRVHGAAYFLVAQTSSSEDLQRRPKRYYTHLTEHVFAAKQLNQTHEELSESLDELEYPFLPASITAMEGTLG